MLAPVALAVVAVVVAGLVSGGGSSFPPVARGDRGPHRIGPPAALAARGEKLARAGRLAASVPVLELAVKRLGHSHGPMAASASLVLGQALVALHRCPAAVTYLVRAVTLRPESVAASTSLASARACAAPPPPPPKPQPAHHPKAHPGHPKPPGHEHGHHGHGPGQGDNND
jgi:hypothetical protein